MHDPMTVAFEILSPLKDRPDELFPKRLSPYPHHGMAQGSRKGR